MRAAEFDGVVGGDMKHFGDITKIHGCVVPIADCVIGGSPCQDLSVAGKREGLAGARSGLFMEQIRIVKEMRERDRFSGRTGQFVRPRYMVWENVPGAFSSNDTEDFRAVLEETARVADADAVIPRPPKKWANAGCIMGDGWSIAWRVLDAQFWGVPQRRRRIALVADFGGYTASEILFERNSVCGNPPQGGEAWQGTAGDSAGGVGEASGLTNRGIVSGNVAETARAECHGALPMVCAGFKLGNSEQARSIGFQEERSPTLNAECGGNKPAICYDMTHASDVIRECGETAPTLQSRMGTGENQIPLTLENRVCDEVAHTVKQNTGSTFREDADSFICEPVTYPGVGITSAANASNPKPGDPCHTLNQDSRNYVCSTYQKVTGPLMANSHPGSYTGQDAYSDMLVAAVDVRNNRETGEKFGTLQAKENGGQSLNYMGAVRIGYAVRRLTPLECERLQGFPDGWTDIGAWTDSNGKLHKESSDSARYKALGNSIALPPWKWVLKRLCAFYERDATMASLFDGIGGFPLIWEQLNGKGSCLWASEIEEFPIAVTKRRFGEVFT